MRAVVHSLELAIKVATTDQTMSRHIPAPLDFGYTTNFHRCDDDNDPVKKKVLLAAVVRVRARVCGRELA